MPEPVLDIDLVDAAESLMVQPMLMEPPGEARRRHRPAGRIVAMRVAAAAVLTLTAVGIGWAGFQGYARWQSEAVPNDVAIADQEPGQRDSTADDRPSSGAQGTPAPDDVVVHYPGRLAHDIANTRQASGPADRGVATGGAGDHVPATDTPIRANLALNVAATSPAAARDAMVDLAERTRSAHRAMVSLTENFSYEEAEQLGMAALAEAARRRAAERTGPAIAGSPSRRAGQSDIETLDEHRESAGTVSRHLVGAREVAPELEQQLVYSELGATLTLTVRVDAIDDVLAALNQHDNLGVTLRLLVDDDETAVAPGALNDAARWRTATRAASQIRAMLADLPPDALVHIPIIVQPASN